MHRTGLVTGLLCLLVASGHAADWPQFRGPTGQGHSSETGLPLAWSESQNVAWKVRIDGSGWSSPVVANGRVWLTVGRNVGRSSVSLRAVAFDADSGRQLIEVFRVSSPSERHQKNSHASPTPVIDGDRVHTRRAAPL